IANASYAHKLTAYIWTAMQDKNNNPRICATQWLKVLLDVHAEGSKGAIEHGAGIENIEKSIKKGLADANPDVRTPMREMYWTFAAIWPERAEAIMLKLDSTGKKALEKANVKGDQVQSGRSSVMTVIKPPESSTVRNPVPRVSIKKFAMEQRK